MITSSNCSVSGTPIIEKVITTPAGKYAVAACGQGLHTVLRVRGEKFVVDTSINVLEQNPVDRREVETPPRNTKDGDDPYLILQKIVEWFHYYFAEPSKLAKAFPQSIDMCASSATEFQITVWKTLRDDVPFGSTVSYGELAERAGRPKAARAVGSAMKNNPFCVFVPCHRVIRSNSDLGNYNGGVEIKHWLLEHEKTMSEKGLLNSEAFISPYFLPKP